MKPEGRARFDFERLELARLYDLPDRWLGEAVLRLARKARDEAPDHYADADRSYSTGLIWNVAPEIARRLGCTLSPNESQDPDIRYADDSELRRLTGHYLVNANLRGIASAYRKANPQGPSSAHDMLEMLHLNGNPIAIALDRLVPPDMACDNESDPLAHAMIVMSRQRGTSVAAGWSPAHESEYKATINTPRKTSSDDPDLVLDQDCEFWS